jgi:hypothetical protein
MATNPANPRSCLRPDRPPPAPPAPRSNAPCSAVGQLRPGAARPAGAGRRASRDRSRRVHRHGGAAVKRRQPGGKMRQAGRPRRPPSGGSAGPAPRWRGSAGAIRPRSPRSGPGSARAGAPPEGPRRSRVHRPSRSAATSARSICKIAANRAQAVALRQPGDRRERHRRQHQCRDQRRAERPRSRPAHRPSCPDRPMPPTATVTARRLLGIARLVRADFKRSLLAIG